MVQALQPDLRALDALAHLGSTQLRTTFSCDAAAAPHSHWRDFTRGVALATLVATAAVVVVALGVGCCGCSCGLCARGRSAVRGEQQKQQRGYGPGYRRRRLI